MKKDRPLSPIEEDSKGQRLDQTIAKVRDKFADLDPSELQSLIDEATQSTREAMNSPCKNKA